jgi:ankyrin repeat protein
MNNQQIAILQSIEAVLRAGSDNSETRMQLDAIFALLSPIERQILLNYEFAPVAVISPMYLAVQLGLQEVLAWLVQYGASPDGPDRLDQPLLLSAIEEGYFDSAQALLKLGANSHALTKNGSNSVMLALGQGNQSLVELLCGVGVSLKHVNHDGLTALHFAAMSGNLLLVQWVQAQTALALNVETRDGRHALHFCRSYTLFKWLQGADPDADLGQVFSDGDQALHYFCLNGHLDIVRDLLDFGIDANVLGRAKNSALHYAVSSGSVALVQLLIARGAKVEARNNAGMRPLHWAAELGDIEMLEVLLSHRAKVKIKGNSNWIILQTH